jgi:hypothetical protein
VPVVKWYTASGWTVAQQPGTDCAWRVLYDGIPVGWVLCERRGWRWQIDPVRGERRTLADCRFFTTWAAAVASLAEQPRVVRVVGRLVGPGMWVEATGLRWAPGMAADQAGAGLLRVGAW